MGPALAYRSGVILLMFFSSKSFWGDLGSRKGLPFNLFLKTRGNARRDRQLLGPARRSGHGAPVGRSVVREGLVGVVVVGVAGVLE